MARALDSTSQGPHRRQRSDLRRPPSPSFILDHDLGLFSSGKHLFPGYRLHPPAIPVCKSRRFAAHQILPASRDLSLRIENVTQHRCGTMVAPCNLPLTSTPNFQVALSTLCSTVNTSCSRHACNPWGSIVVTWMRPELTVSNLAVGANPRQHPALALNPATIKQIPELAFPPHLAHPEKLCGSLGKVDAFVVIDLIPISQPLPVCNSWTGSSRELVSSARSLHSGPAAPARSGRSRFPL